MGYLARTVELKPARMPDRMPDQMISQIIGHMLEQVIGQVRRDSTQEPGAR